MRGPLTGMVLLVLGAASPAHAQRFPFERTIEAANVELLDIVTDRGGIVVAAGSDDRLIVNGEVSIRVGFNVPADAIELAKAVTAAPPIAREGAVVRLRPPADRRAKSAVTVSYSVTVPRWIVVSAGSESGALEIDGIAGSVTARTQSGAIRLQRLAGHTTVSSGSGAVNVEGAQRLDAKTQSGGVSTRGMIGDLRVRTGSGAVEILMAGGGTVDVETGSSGVTARGVRGGLIVVTRSGRVDVEGSPERAWRLATQSSAIALQLDPRARLDLDAASRSGDVKVEGVALEGDQQKHRAAGRINGGGPEVHARTGSGAIRILIGPGA
jgi:hypothetical protein